VCDLAEKQKEKPFNFLNSLTLIELIQTYASFIPTSAESLSAKRKRDDCSDDVQPFRHESHPASQQQEQPHYQELELPTQQRQKASCICQ
jgi:hypothetical protein